MARKTIKIEIPTGGPDDMITLAEGIASRQTDLGSAAVLDSTEVTELAAQSETLSQEYFANVKTAPIVSFEHSSVLRRSQSFDKSREGCKALLRDGFTISIGTAKTPGPRKPKP